MENSKPEHSGVAPLTIQQSIAVYDWVSWKERLEAALIAKEIPSHMHEGVCRHVLYGDRVGGFLTTLLSNDTWLNVLQRADESNLQALVSWWKLIYNDLPRESWGSRETVEAWSDLGGLAGQFGLTREIIRSATKGRE